MIIMFISNMAAVGFSPSRPMDTGPAAASLIRRAWQARRSVARLGAARPGRARHGD